MARGLHNRKVEYSPLETNQHMLDAAECRLSYKYFVKLFWNTVPGASPMRWNWHMDVLCDELEKIARGVFNEQPAEYDLLINISPGTGKSSLCSILFHPWTWIIMPTAKHIVASHGEQLVLTLANKARTVIESDLYKKLFPEIVLSDRQDKKELYENTLGGSRLSCTVGGKSPIGQHGQFVVFDDPIDHEKSRSKAEIEKAARFKSEILDSRMMPPKENSVFYGVMQRLSPIDPSGQLLEDAKKEGARPVRHICLPSELTENVHPPELKKHYIDGLMDPVLLSEKLLKTKRANRFVYAGQYLQEPFITGGGLFQKEYFAQTKKAAPYAAKRIRFWDRASSVDIGACYTAGVLMARDDEDNYYVEHVVHGQWEPSQRNAIMRQCAIRDRAKYGKYAPLIYVEAEGGSSGRDAWKGVVKALQGFYVKEDKPTGSKVVRAEPWSAQLAAMNVYMIVDGSWDYNDYVIEHCAFPVGKYMDQVDASSACFTLLSNIAYPGTLRSYSYGGPRRLQRGKLAIVIVKGRERLQELDMDNRKAVLISFVRPDSENKQPPPCSLNNLLETSVVEFAPIDPRDYQDRWDIPEEVYNMLPDQIQMSRTHATQVWKFVSDRNRPQQADLFVLQDDGEGTALSVAYGIVDALRLPRNHIYVLDDPEALVDGPAPIPYIYETTKTNRSLVPV
jgi:predicted phage terminase large subunit-like protein